MAEHGTPTVLYFAPPSFVGDTLQRHLPRHWRYESLSEFPTEHEKLTKIARADFLMHSGVMDLKSEHLDAAQNLRLIARQGVGLDKLNLADIASRGIMVAITPTGTEAIAEHTIMLMIAVGRHLVEIHKNVCEEGSWPKFAFRSRSLALFQQTVGIVGFGRIGQAVLERLLAFRVRPLVYARDISKHAKAWGPEVEFSNDLAHVASLSDFMTIHLALTPDTRHIVNRSVIDAMRAGSFLINTSRGELVDEAALVDALTSGHLGGAGLDVLETEPAVPDNPLFSCPNVIVTSHIAGGTRDTVAAKAAAISQDLVAVWNGESPQHRIV